MSVIIYRAQDIGALVGYVLMENKYKEAFEITRDKFDNYIYKVGEEAKDNRIFCFFNRLFIANQLAGFITYKSDCKEDGSFTIHQLQDEDIKGLKFENTFLNGPRSLNSVLRSLRYNIISNGGRSFFDSEDTERLENLINFTANEIIESTEKKGS